VLQSCIDEIKLASLYPRFDVNVSKFRNHLLKAPFSIHPKTGNISVPIDPRNLDWDAPPNMTVEGSLFELDEATQHGGPAVEVGQGCWEATRMADGARHMQDLTRSLEVDAMQRDLFV